MGAHYLILTDACSLSSAHPTPFNSTASQLQAAHLLLANCISQIISTFLVHFPLHSLQGPVFVLSSISVHVQQCLITQQIKEHKCTDTNETLDIAKYSFCSPKSREPSFSSIRLEGKANSSRLAFLSTCTFFFPPKAANIKLAQTEMANIRNAKLGAKQQKCK